MRNSGERLQAVEYTRGVAAFMVMWFHFTYLMPDGVLRASGLYGYLGVEAFFVISGFIIPYAMDLRHYGSAGTVLRSSAAASSGWSRPM